jgi:hypothetical protein
MCVCVCVCVCARARVWMYRSQRLALYYSPLELLEASDSRHALGSQHLLLQRAQFHHNGSCTDTHKVLTSTSLMPNQSQRTLERIKRGEAVAPAFFGESVGGNARHVEAFPAPQCLCQRFIRYVLPEVANEEARVV